MTRAEQAAAAEEREAKRLGAVAFHQDKPRAACPHADDRQRELWLGGYDAAARLGKTRPDMYAARGAGFRAFQIDVRRDECPFPSRSQSRYDWVDGWDEAKRSKEKERLSD